MDLRAQHIAPGVFRVLGAPPALDLGERVTLTLERSRSMASHRHQFAWVRDAWASLPEALAGAPWAASPETLRKHALIARGFCDVAVLDCGTATTARRVHAALMSAETTRHGYAVGQVRGPVVTIWTPQSQSVRAMGAARFKESKEAVMDWIAMQAELAARDARVEGQG